MITKKYLLYFKKSETEKPIVYHLVKDYNLIINIFRAKITPEEEGYLVLDVAGDEQDIERGMDYVRTLGVSINEGKHGLRWEETRCTHCGACIPHCPTDALQIPDRKTMRIDFKEEFCIECLSCIRACVFGACISMF